jgi:XTP/dITP diphosphohydrolase
MKLIFASHNKNKVKEIAAILPKNFELVGLDDLNYTEEIDETGATLEENALIKAKHIYEIFNLNCFADDSGLEVETLNNEPGVYSARYAGIEKNDDANMNKLLENLSHKENRKARFRTVIALILDGKEYLFEGIVNGKIINEKRGEKGFGYDPIFVPNGFEKTFAELPSEEKNQISHRALATNKLIGFLNENLCE